MFKANQWDGNTPLNINPSCQILRYLSSKSQFAAIDSSMCLIFLLSPSLMEGVALVFQCLGTTRRTAWTNKPKSPFYNFSRDPWSLERRAMSSVYLIYDPQTLDWHPKWSYPGIALSNMRNRTQLLSPPPTNIVTFWENTMQESRRLVPSGKYLTFYFLQPTGYGSLNAKMWSAKF